MKTIIVIYTLAVTLLVGTAVYGYDPIVIPADDYVTGVDYISCPNGTIEVVEYNLSGSDNFIEIRAYFHVRNRDPRVVPFLIFEFPAVEASVGPVRIDLILPYQSPQPVTVEFLEKTYPAGICDIPRLPNEQSTA